MKGSVSQREGREREGRTDRQTDRHMCSVLTTHLPSFFLPPFHWRMTHVLRASQQSSSMLHCARAGKTNETISTEREGSEWRAITVAPQRWASGLFHPEAHIPQQARPISTAHLLQLTLKSSPPTSRPPPTHHGPTPPPRLSQLTNPPRPPPHPHQPVPTPPSSPSPHLIPHPASSLY